MRNLTELKNLIDDKIVDCFIKFNESIGHEYCQIPKIVYDLTGRTAGQYFPYYNKIRVNVDILLKYQEDYINSTIVHELAHCFVELHYEHATRGGCKPHGKEWKYVMQILGIQNPKRCHSYSVAPSRKIRRWAYSCGCANVHSVTTTLHNKMRRGQRRTCCTCGEEIIFSGKEII